MWTSVRGPWTWMSRVPAAALLMRTDLVAAGPAGDVDEEAVGAVGEGVAGGASCGAPGLDAEEMAAMVVVGDLADGDEVEGEAGDEAGGDGEIDVDGVARRGVENLDVNSAAVEQAVGEEERRRRRGEG